MVFYLVIIITSIIKIILPLCDGIMIFWGSGRKSNYQKITRPDCMVTCFSENMECYLVI